ncbi:MAG: hypothetical protein QXW19_02250 [Candidatus Bathyarchaeia archaeon]
MKAKYKDDMPVMKLKVIGPNGMKEYDAYLDTCASRSLIPEKDAISLGLPYAGDAPIITGTGKTPSGSIKLRFHSWMGNS